jgi:hypothetical protein
MKYKPICVPLKITVQYLKAAQNLLQDQLLKARQETPGSHKQLAKYEAAQDSN